VRSGVLSDDQLFSRSIAHRESKRAIVSWTQAKLRAAGFAAFVVAGLVVAGCGSSSSTSSKAAAASSSGPSVSGVAVSTAHGTGGLYLTGASGRALYLWAADHSGTSSCAGACAQTWPPLLTKGVPTATGSVKASDLGTLTRSNGSKQVTYMGHPLYYYVGDTGAGTWHGQGSSAFGAKWWLVAPSGSAIEASAKTVSSGAASSSSSSSGGGWG
jgi:predicted lipoprotein with Yx(FWY)xxD motif